MASKRGNVTLIDQKRFEVLGIVSLALPPPWWWHTEDINRAGCVGAIFRCYEEGNSQELAYLMVADISLDGDEPNIANFEASDAEKFDQFLEAELNQQMEQTNRKMIRWMSSHLSIHSNHKALTTAYIARENKRDRQYVDLRIRIHQSNMVIGCCFDVDRAEHLARPILSALNGAVISD